MCDTCAWEDVTEQIRGMLDDERYTWAEDTLSGIGETIDSREHATERQKEAVENIRTAGERGRL